MVSFSFTEVNVYTGGCGDLLQYWRNLNSDAANKSIDAFLYRASLTIEEIMAGVLVGSENDCSNQQVISEFYRNLCYYYCLTPLKKEPFIEINKVRCGFNCCVRTISWCRDENGDLQSTIPSFESSGECTYEVSDACKGTPISGCEHECGPIEE